MFSFCCIHFGWGFEGPVVTSKNYKNDLIWWQWHELLFNDKIVVWIWHSIFTIYLYLSFLQVPWRIDFYNGCFNWLYLNINAEDTAPVEEKRLATWGTEVPDDLVLDQKLLSESLKKVSYSIFIFTSWLV